MFKTWTSSASYDISLFLIVEDRKFENTPIKFGRPEVILTQKILGRGLECSLVDLIFFHILKSLKCAIKKIFEFCYFMVRNWPGMLSQNICWIESRSLLSRPPWPYPTKPKPRSVIFKHFLERESDYVRLKAVLMLLILLRITQKASTVAYAVIT